MCKKVILPIILITTACHLSPMRIDVAPELQNQEEIKAEIREGVEFFCQERNIDDCTYWSAGLWIRVGSEVTYHYVAGPDNKDILAACNGVYYFGQNYLWIKWFDGIHTNALFHELMHKHTRERGHSSEFLEETSRIKKAWRVQEGLE